MSKVPAKDDQDYYNLCRQQVVAEDNLVNHRMTWLLLFEGFLLAILAGVVSQNASSHIGDIELFKWLICVMGMCGSILVGIGIWAAQKAIKCVIEEYLTAYGGKQGMPPNLPPLVGGDTPHLLGAWPLFLPAVCFCVWVVVGWQVH